MPSRRACTARKDDIAGHSKGEKLWDEVDVLQPASIQAHPDDWPCFVLKDAIVYKKDGVTVGNLLHTDVEGPMIVRGSLEVDKDLRNLQIVRNLKAPQAEVKNVRSFSMADKPVTIWALGKTGWFEIRPARVYRPVFDKMAEGVKLYYFLIDIYEGNKDHTKSLEMSMLFDKYARKFDMSMAPPQIAKLIEDHSKFLLSQMRKHNETVRWVNTCIYRWLNDGCPSQATPHENIVQVASSKSEQGVGVKNPAIKDGSGKKRASFGRSRTVIDLESVSSKRAILQSDGTLRPRQPAGLRLPSASLNWNFSPEDGDESQTHQSKKRRRISSPENVIVELSDIGTPDPGSDEVGEDENEDGDVEWVLTSEPIPTSEPQGPSGLWTCYVKGCAYSVTSASEPEGKEKVRLHFLEHADELDAREQLVLQEARPHLPVNYLLEKLRSMGKGVRLAKQKNIGGRIVSKPIKKEMIL